MFLGMALQSNCVGLKASIKWTLMSICLAFSASPVMPTTRKGKSKASTAASSPVKATAKSKTPRGKVSRALRKTALQPVDGSFRSFASIFLIDRLLEEIIEHITQSVLSPQNPPVPFTPARVSPRKTQPNPRYTHDRASDEGEYFFPH